MMCWKCGREMELTKTNEHAQDYYQCDKCNAYYPVSDIADRVDKLNYAIKYIKTIWNE